MVEDDFEGMLNQFWPQRMKRMCRSLKNRDSFGPLKIMTTSSDSKNTN